MAKWGSDEKSGSGSKTTGGAKWTAKKKAAEPEKKKSGGGFLGGLWQVSQAVKRYPSDIVRGLVGLTEEYTSLGFDKPVPTSVEAAKRDYPITHALVTSPVETAKTLNPQDLSDLAKGDWSKTALAKRVEREGVLGTGLATASDVSLLAGGAGALGKVAGLGKLAKAANLEHVAGASSKAAGLSKLAKPGELTRASEAARVAGAGTKADDLLRAAEQVRTARGLRAEVGERGLGYRAGSKATEIAQDVSRLGARIEGAPAAPYVAGAKLLGKGAKAVGVAEKVAPLVQRAQRYADVSNLYHERVNAPSTEALYRFIDKGEDIPTVTTHLKEQFPEVRDSFDKFDAEVTAQRAEFKKAQEAAAAQQGRPLVEAPQTPEQRVAEIRRFEQRNNTILREGFHGQIAEMYGEKAMNRITPGGARSFGQQLDDQKLVPFDPKTGRVATKLTPDTIVIPKDVFHQVKMYGKGTNGPSRYSVVRYYDKATGVWKNTVLALSPRWHVGNILSNTMLAMVGAGLSPVQMVKYGREAAKMIKNGELPEDLVSRGYRFSEHELLNPPKEGWRGKPRKFINASYRLNDFVDNANRTMIYVAKRDKGFSHEAAVKLALRTAGDFSRLTPFEKTYIRRIFPFYSWMKHSTKLAVRLPLENPARVAWTLHLADMGRDLNPDPGAEEKFMENTVGIGGHRLNLDVLNPLGRAVDPTLSGYGFSVNPLARAAFVGTTGTDPAKGFNPLRTPEAEADFPMERAVGGIAAQQPVRFGQYLTQAVPWTRMAQDAVAGETKTRLATGHEAEKQYPGQQGRLLQLAKFFGANVRPDATGQEPVKKTATKKTGGSAKWATKK